MNKSMEIYTTAEIARELNISTRRVRTLANTRNLGEKRNPRLLIFSEKDLVNMKSRRKYKSKTP